MIEMLKNGSGIHIKKKNRGKFTSYCGGKVTDECIRRAKSSGNPTLVKRATFADNARHFKHRLGGTLNKLQKGGVAWLPKDRQEYNDKLMLRKGQFMIDSIANRGIDPIKGAGVAGSIALESSFNPNARAGSHLGYVQNEPWIVSYVKKHYGGYDHNAQMRFILDGLTTGLPDSISSHGRQLQDRFNSYNWKTYKTPEDAAKAWEKSYEKSGGQGNNQRLYYSKLFYTPIKEKLSKQRLASRKKGGKVFVPGHDIADSNPKAYKYVKKHYKMKGAQGGIMPDETIPDLRNIFTQSGSIDKSFDGYTKNGNVFLVWQQSMDEAERQRKLQEQSEQFQMLAGWGEKGFNYLANILSNRIGTNSFSSSNKSFTNTSGYTPAPIAKLASSGESILTKPKI